ncbi:MAG: AAA family ATPase [Gemmatimonadales bacterium]|nr:MAG: AAA family ATPase [Gemmatimonadales bacterium]
MRLLRISTPSFGALRELDTGPDTLPSLVVIQGRNEAGKSTFFELLATAMYGFYPASRENHPYAPWDGGVAEVRTTLRLRDGREWEVVRRLLSSPQGSLLSGTVEEDLRNRTLPFVEHVPRAVFRHVFALTLGELASLEGESWEAVQDRLIGAMGATDLRSAREVVEELEGEAGRLWRPTRRGSQDVRQMEARLRELRRSRSDASAQESEIRQIAAELIQARQELAQARDEREACRAYVERYRALLPIREQLLRVDALQRDAGDHEVLEGLPRDPEGRSAELGSRVADLGARIQDLEEAVHPFRAAVEAFDERAQTLLEFREAVETLVTRHAALEATRLRVAQLDQELRDFHRRIETLTWRLLGRDADAELRERILEVPLAPLEASIREVETLRRRLEDSARAGTKPTPVAPDHVPLWPSIAALLLAVLALVVTPLVGGTALRLAGAAALGIGLVLLLQWYRSLARRRRATLEDDQRATQLTRDRREREEELGEARGRLTDLLTPLRPGPGTSEPGPDFAAQFERLQEWVRDEADRKRGLAGAQGDIGSAEAAGEALRHLLEEEDREADPAALPHLLSRLLQSALARRDAATGARRELERLERELDLVRNAELDARGELGALEERIGHLGGGDLQEGFRVAKERLQAKERARRILEELELTHPRLDAIRARIAEAERSGEDWAVDAEALVHRQAREQELSAEIEDLLRRIQAREKDLEHLGGRTTLDELDGEILELDWRTTRLSEQRDRLWVLGRIVREAERRIRDEHQPAILREAGRRLARLTKGRYDRLLLAGRDGREFRVQGPATPTPLAIDAPLSAGTREQIYLSLRLSVLDQLDRAGERLPVLLDELLVNWDPDRREAGLDLLAEVAEERQCFFFTCHPEMAGRLADRGARLIRLAGP